MKIYLQLTLFLCLTLLSACIANTPHTSSTTNNKYILTATGSGKSAQQAKDNALENLSKMIYVQVNSNFSSKENLHNNTFNSSYTNQLNLQSNIKFIGIEYFNVRNYKKQYYTEIGLSKEALQATINFIYNNLNILIVNNLSKYELTKELDNINMLFALNMHAKNNNIELEELNLYNYTLQSYKQLLQNKLNSEVIVKFITKPNNVVVTINNNNYNAFEDIYLPSGNVLYSITAKGYITKNNSITLKKNDNLQIEVFLQKKVANNIPIKIILHNNSNISNNEFNNFLKEIIATNQMTLQQKANNSIELSVSNITSSKINNNYYNNSTVLLLKITINNKINSINIPINYLSSNSEEIPFNFIKSSFIKATQLYFANLY